MDNIAPFSATAMQSPNYNKTTGLPNPAGAFSSANQTAPNYNKVTGMNDLPPTSNLINTSTASRTTFTKNSSVLDNAYATIGGMPTPETPASPETPTDATAILNNTNDPIVQGLNTLATNSDAATKALLLSTQATYQNQINKVNSQYDNYKRGLQQLGIEHNDAQATPDLLSGHIQQAATEQMDKIHGLAAEESKALIDAKAAKDANDFKTLQAKMDYVKQVQSEKASAIKDMYDTIANADKQLTFDIPGLYQAFNTLDSTDKESFIKAVAQKYGVSPISVQSTLLAEQSKEEKENLATQNTKSTIAKRNATGTGTGGTFKTSSAIAQLTPLMEDQKGDDGYIDPYKWVEARTSWQKQGGTAASFKSNFISYLNPESYKLAGYTPPKSTGSISLDDIK